ncbi:MAG: MFS transporter, partial [Deltaproteobacteria bacterium]|nr:MFS transporter [Deltaproteobacteria bacterium]
MSKKRKNIPRVPATVWTLGMVSMLMDVSSEMIHSLLPLYLVTGLGASTLAVGLIEGGGEAIASITKAFSGTISDYLGRRKLLATLGYGMSALVKPVFPLVGAVSWVASARFMDRLGKGIRGAPRDALIADITPKGLRGAAYGLRQSLDTLGAFAGPLLAVWLMVLLQNDIQAVFWVAVIPAMGSFLLMALAVREPEKTTPPQPPPVFNRAYFSKLTRTYWMVVLTGGTLTLARFSEAFLLLRAADAGISPGLIPGVLALLSLTYALSSYPAGRLSDSMGRSRIMALGMLVLLGADLLLGLWGSVGGILAGVVLWGLHMGLTQGLLAAMVADTLPEEIRG